MQRGSHAHAPWPPAHPSLYPLPTHPPSPHTTTPHHATPPAPPHLARHGDEACHPPSRHHATPLPPSPPAPSPPTCPSMAMKSASACVSRAALVSLIWPDTAGLASTSLLSTRGQRERGPGGMGTRGWAHGAAGAGVAGGRAGCPRPRCCNPGLGGTACNERYRTNTRMHPLDGVLVRGGGGGQQDLRAVEQQRTHLLALRLCGRARWAGWRTGWCGGQGVRPRGKAGARRGGGHRPSPSQRSAERRGSAAGSKAKQSCFLSTTPTLVQTQQSKAKLIYSYIMLKHTTHPCPGTPGTGP